MTQYLYKAGSAALALALLGLPAFAAHAEDADASAGVNVSAGALGDHIIATTTLRGEAGGEVRAPVPERFLRGGVATPDEEASSSDRHRGEDRMGEENENASSSDEERGNATSTAAHERNELRFEAHLDDLEAHLTAILGASSTPVANLEELKARIDARASELDDFTASSSSEDRATLENAARVGLAAHALLIARDLLGASSTVGVQVSQIATELNASIASTTEAQAKIASRGFFTKLFFGGDEKAAAVLKDAAERNEERIQKITELLNEASISPEVKATLEARLQGAEDAQARFASEAKAQAGLWGIFSWRLF